MKYFAHAGESHDTAGQGIWHTITGEWYVALPMYTLLLIVLSASVYFVSHKSKAATATVLMLALLFGGVGLYAVSPPVSVMSLSAGFALALGTMVISLGGGKGKRRKG